MSLGLLFARFQIHLILLFFHNRFSYFPLKGVSEIFRRFPLTLTLLPFIDREIKTFEKYGFDACHLGDRILKVETAVTALLSRLYPG